MTLREQLLARAWTPRELRILRSSYRSKGAAYVANRTGRAFKAVCAKAARLGLKNRPPWTDIENRRLRNWWGVETVAAIASKLGRSKWAVFHQAGEVLGLKRGVQAGQESLKATARRTGYSYETLLRVLAASGVKLKRPVSEPGSKRCRFVVDTVDVDEAVAAWNATETVNGAARARGIGSNYLRALLERTPGVPPKLAGKCWRVPTAVIDRALAGEKRRAA